MQLEDLAGNGTGSTRLARFYASARTLCLLVREQAQRVQYSGPATHGPSADSSRAPPLPAARQWRRDVGIALDVVSMASVQAKRVCSEFSSYHWHPSI